MEIWDVGYNLQWKLRNRNFTKYMKPEKSLVLAPIWTPISIYSNTLSSTILSHFSSLRMSDPIAEYFTKYPAFTFKPSSRDWRQVGAFNALAAHFRWSQERRQREYLYFKDTWAQVVESEFEESTLDHYKSLCKELAIEPIPESIEECREELSRVYVNIVDLVQYRRDRKARRHPEPLIFFDNAQELRDYCKREEKWCPVETAIAEMLEVLLRPLE